MAQPWGVLGSLLLAFAVGIIVVFVIGCTIEFAYLHPSPLALTLYALYAFMVIGNLFYNYFKAVVTNPGRITDDEEVLISLRGSEESDSSFPVCQKCNHRKPPRAHHCKVCKTCVLLMDHHCPWINNCVGYFNRRFFVLFLFWTGLALISFVFIVVEHVAKILFQYPLPPNPPLPIWLVIGAWFYGCGLTFAVNLLLGINLYLVGSGQSSIEWEQNKRLKVQARSNGQPFHNQWNLGWKANFQDVFGDRHWIQWPFPTQQKPKGNGVIFETVPYDPSKNHETRGSRALFDFSGR
eukprot:Phypoly_transcript_14982.p1 GENE.Phypoly_transcript_14982~~Phypoly_transcript_14982.p1  ORF type:complete len:302 (+),score=33.30 Phypoly_transcript_14982:27-908(+)